MANPFPSIKARALLRLLQSELGYVVVRQSGSHRGLAAEGRPGLTFAFHARLGRALTVPGQARSLLEGPANGVGEVVYVCAVPSDTIGWLAGQLDPRGDAVVVAVAIAEPFVFTVPVATGDGGVSVAGVPIAARGYAPGTTIGELLRDTPIVQPVTVPHPVAS